MAIENLPIWSFRPNWSQNILEALEWLTEVMTSPTAAEQRVGLRLSPRRSFEFTINPWKEDRSYFDHMMTAYGASDWYLPVWHDVELMMDQVTVGSTSVPMVTDFREFFPGEPAVFLGQSAMEYEAVEVQNIDAGVLTFKTPTTKTWDRGSRLYPGKKARLQQQPASMKKLAERVVQTNVGFYVDAPNNIVGEGYGWGQLWGLIWGGAATPPWYIQSGWGRAWGYNWSGSSSLPYLMYLGYPVMPERPNEANQLSSGFSRVLQVLDNNTSLIQQIDTAGRAFSMQQYDKTMHRREDHANFRALLYYLKGQLVPIWMPTYYQDFNIAQDGISGNDFLAVTNTGFLLSGGPRPGREHIIIERFNKLPVFIKIKAVQLSGSLEHLVFNKKLTENIPVSDVRRISFMELNRNTQDRVEITHQTDMQGASVCSMQFKAAPDIRQASLIL